MHKLDEFKEVYYSLPGSKAYPLAKWLVDEGLDLYREAFKQETTKAPSGSPDDQLVRQAFSHGFNDSTRKLQQSAFFAANAAIFLTVCKDLSEKILKIAEHNAAPTFESQHFNLLNNTVLDALYLLEEWATAKEGIPETYGIWKNWIHASLEMSHAVQQLYFGGSHFFAFTDNASESSIALIRVALETRLRFGFGILGCKERGTGAFVPLPLKTVFEVLEAHEQSITLSVPLSDLRRIYGWSNMYIHTGVRDYIWLPYFATKYLNSFFRGGEHASGSSIYAGIITSKATIEAIQADVEAKIDTTTQDLWKVPAEQCKTVLARGCAEVRSASVE